MNDKSKVFCDDFMRGQSDCKKGHPHKAGRSSAYDRGYSVQYELEQIQSELSASRRHGH